MADFYEAYKDKAVVLLIYIREAHPAFEEQTADDAGWKVIDKVVFHQPKTFEERRKLAETACENWKMPIPTLVDTMASPSAGELFQAWPNRSYVIDKEGKIVEAAPKGPAGVRPHDAEVALRKLLGMPEEGCVTPVDRASKSSRSKSSSQQQPTRGRPPVRR